MNAQVRSRAAGLASMRRADAEAHCKRDIPAGRYRDGLMIAFLAARPIVRIANVGLEPGDETLDSLLEGVENGSYVEGRGSFSIDQKRCFSAGSCVGRK